MPSTVCLLLFEIFHLMSILFLCTFIVRCKGLTGFCFNIYLAFLFKKNFVFKLNQNCSHLYKTHIRKLLLFQDFYFTYAARLKYNEIGSRAKLLVKVRTVLFHIFFFEAVLNFKGKDKFVVGHHNEFLEARFKSSPSVESSNFINQYRFFLEPIKIIEYSFRLGTMLLISNFINQYQSHSLGKPVSIPKRLIITFNKYVVRTILAECWLLECLTTLFHLLRLSAHSSQNCALNFLSFRLH